MKVKIWAVVLALALITVPLALHAQQAAPPDASVAEAPADRGKMECPAHWKMGAGHHHMMGMSKDMMAQHEKWSAKFEEWDNRLNEKLAAMNSAKGDQKVAAMAAVINEMAGQRKEMREMFAERHAQRMKMCAMMSGAGYHGGMCPGCPMMEGHKGEYNKEGAGHGHGSPHHSGDVTKSGS